VLAHGGRKPQDVGRAFSNVPWSSSLRIYPVVLFRQALCDLQHALQLTGLYRLCGCLAAQRTMRLALIAVSVLLSACAPITVGSYADRYGDFTGYRTYDWGPADALPTGDPPDCSRRRW